MRSTASSGIKDFITIQLTHRDNFAGQFIGKSSKAPCPNLKKLIIPASTAAMTTIFFPAFKTAKGLGLRGATLDACGVEEDDHSHGRTRRSNDCSTGAVVGDGKFGGAGFSDSNVRRRGTGGGSSGRMSKRSFSSERDGTGVVRALKVKTVSLPADVWKGMSVVLDHYNGEVWRRRRSLFERRRWLINIVEYLVR